MKQGDIVQHTKTGQTYEVVAVYGNGRVHCKMMFRPELSESQKGQTIKGKFLEQFFEVEAH